MSSASCNPERLIHELTVCADPVLPRFGRGADGTLPGPDHLDRRPGQQPGHSVHGPATRGERCFARGRHQDPLVECEFHQEVLRSRDRQAAEDHRRLESWGPRIPRNRHHPRRTGNTEHTFGFRRRAGEPGLGRPERLRQPGWYLCTQCSGPFVSFADILLWRRQPWGNLLVRRLRRRGDPCWDSGGTRRNHRTLTSPYQPFLLTLL